MFCKYSKIFGEVNTGLHSYRIFNIAIIDVILTVLLAYIISLIKITYKFYYILIILFILSIIAHRLFCVRTTIDKLLFTPLKLSDEQLSTQKTFQSLGISTSCKVSYIGN